ncbi:hypothetical protein CCP4SC76_5650006 [Gammaproteobacteria bacterium]
MLYCFLSHSKTMDWTSDNCDGLNELNAVIIPSNSFSSSSLRTFVSNVNYFGRSATIRMAG